MTMGFAIPALTGQMSSCRRFRRLIVTAIDATVNGPCLLWSCSHQKASFPIAAYWNATCIFMLERFDGFFRVLCSHDPFQKG